MHDESPHKPIRVAIVGTKGIPAQWGGIERYVEQVGKRLATRGCDVTVFCSKWYSAGFNGDRYAGMRIARVPTLRLQATDALTNAFFAGWAAANGPYDIVHFHNLASYFTVPLVRKCGKLTVTTTHAMESNWDNRKYNRLGRWVIKSAFDIGIRHAQGTSTVARHLQDKMQRRCGVKPVLLPAGLEPAKPASARLITEKYGLCGDDYLLFLGRIDPIKRIEWVVDLQRSIPPALRIVIAGGAQDSMTAGYLRTLRRTAGGNSRVVFTGAVTGREKEELFSNCLLFLAPSADEGLPLTVLEAASYGKPCIVSDLPAFQAVIAHDRTGFLFPQKDQQQFDATVARVLQSPDRLQAVGRAAKSELTPRFDWDRTAQQTVSMYRRLLGQRSGGSGR